jgi:predicted ATPase
LETGSVLVAARAKVELARLSHEPASVKISSALSALEVFQSSDAYNDTVECLLLLAQLDPTSAEFREMARVSQRRKSSARGSKGNSQAVIADLENMEDVPLAGRKEELTTLIKAVNALRTGNGGGTCTSLVLEAAGGMGKSALLRSFMKDVQASMQGIKMYVLERNERQLNSKPPPVSSCACSVDITWRTYSSFSHRYSSAASQFEASTAFFVWKAVFEGVLSLYQTRKRNNGRGFEKQVVSQEVLLAKLADLIGHDRAKDWHPLLNPLLPFDFPETAETEVLSNTARLELSLDFFYEILENQKEPVLVCLEDAHWCDELSWALIKRCHGALEVLVVTTSRPEDSGGGEKGALQEFLEEEGVQRIVLGALEEGALRQHIAALLEVEAISEQLLKLVESWTGGNLLYIQELVSEATARAKRAQRRCLRRRASYPTHDSARR